VADQARDFTVARIEGDGRLVENERVQRPFPSFPIPLIDAPLPYDPSPIAVDFGKDGLPVAAETASTNAIAPRGQLFASSSGAHCPSLQRSEPECANEPSYSSVACWFDPGRVSFFLPKAWGTPFSAFARQGTFPVPNAFHTCGDRRAPIRYPAPAGTRRTACAN